jgi:hypothetical protein
MIGAITAGLFSVGTPASTNSYESIATVTLGSNASSISFSGIPSGYKHLQIRAMAVNTAGTNGQYAQARVGNGSVDSGTNYSDHYLRGNGTSANAGNAVSASYFRAFGHTGGTTSNARPTSLIMDILDYADTNKNKTFRTLNGADDNNTGVASGEIALTSGLWRSTAAINIITIFAFSQGSASNFGVNSSFALYGIKG